MARFRPGWVPTLATALLLSGPGPASSADVACIDFLRMHGLLRKAQGACGFTAYNPAIVDRAHACFDGVGSGTGVREIYAGAEEFDKLRAMHGLDAACERLATRFPMAVRR